MINDDLMDCFTSIICLLPLVWLSSGLPCLKFNYLSL
jgi:hypothetical protein